MDFTVAAIILAEVIAFLLCVYGSWHEGALIYAEYKMRIRKLKHNEDVLKLKKNTERW